MGRHVLHGALVALLVGVCGSAAFVQDADAALPVSVLRGTNRIIGIGNKALVARVVLPRSVSRPSAEISTSGRVAGIALVEANATGALAKRLAYLSFRFARCRSLPCTDYGRLETGFHRIPAGVYDVYVVQDKLATKITLSVKGLDGRLRLAPERETATQISRIPLRFDNISSGGRRAKISGDGFAIYTFALDGPAPHAASAYAHCIYRSFSDMSPAPYQPSSCPPVGGNGGVVVPGGDGLRLTSSGVLPYLPSALGMWHATVGPVDNVSALAVWVRTRRSDRR